MESFLSNPALLWLALGAALITTEALTCPGIGLFLAGLGACGTAILIQAGLVGNDAVTLQFIWFFGLTSLATAGLWKPLQRFRTNRSQGGAAYNNMIGASGIVAKGGLKRGMTGQVAWSGTLMNAVIDASSAADAIAEGAAITIISVSGNTLSVVPAAEPSRL